MSACERLANSSTRPGLQGVVMFLVFSAPTTNPPSPSCLGRGGRWGRRRTVGPRRKRGERKRTGEGSRSVQQIGDQAVGVVGELAVVDGLAFFEDEETGEGGDGVLLREDAVAVEEDRGSQRL